MQIKIVSIEKHPTDPACYLATLELIPHRIARIFGAKQCIKKFIGHHKHWYLADTHHSAPSSVKKFLNTLFYSGEFRHLLVNIKAESKQKAPPQHK